MRPEVADRCLVLLYLMAVPITIYPIWQLTDIYRAVQFSRHIIVMTSGVSYYLLGIVLLTLGVIHAAGTLRPNGIIMRYASGILLTSFLLALFIAAALSWSVPTLLERSGYSRCGPDTFRIARGETLIYALTECPPSPPSR